MLVLGKIEFSNIWESIDHSRYSHKVFDAEQIISDEKPDRTVFLDDYFDTFDDSLEMIQLVGEWLKESVANPTEYTY
jgi:hypothetical protein